MDDHYDRQMHEDDSVELKWGSDSSKKRRFAAKRGMHLFCAIFLLLVNFSKRLHVFLFTLSSAIAVFSCTERYVAKPFNRSKKYKSC